MALLFLGLLPACATVGISRPASPLPDTGAFERGLLHYVRGELEQAESALDRAIGAHPEDRRALELREEVRRERGEALKPAPDPGAPLQEPLSPETLLRLVVGRNLELRKARYQSVEARAML
jgi:hypothetical protein